MQRPTPHTTRSEAHRLAELDLRVFPCHGIIAITNACTCRQKPGSVCQSPGKHPKIKEWPKRATTDFDQIEEWFGDWHPPGPNLAVAAGQGIVIADIDPCRAGRDTLTSLEAEHGPLPRDWEVQSGSGGAHLYLSLPDGIELGNINTWKADGLEFKGDGGYVIAPPSNHVSGKQYRWISQQGDRPPLIPSSWLEVLQRSSTSTRPMSTKRASRVSPPASADTARSGRRTTERPQIPTDNTDNTDLVSEVSGVSVLSVGVSAAVEKQILEAIKRTCPTRQGTRNRKLMKLGRRLLMIKEIADRDAEQLKPVITYWFDQAQQKIGKRDWDETWSEWLYIWGQWIEDPIDTELVYRANELRKTRPLPPVPTKGYRNEAAKNLVAMCAALSELSQDEHRVFYFSCRDAAELLMEGDPEKNCSTIAAIYRKMVDDGIIEKAEERSRGSYKAQRYVYRGYHPPLHEHDDTSQQTAA